MTSQAPRPTPLGGLLAAFAKRPVLTGDHVVLRPVTEDDAPAMAAIIADPEVRRLTGSAHLMYPVEALRAWYADHADAPNRLDLAITDRATGEVLGEAALFDVDAHNRSCAFRILLGPGARDRGLGSEAVRLIVGHGFERVGLHRIWLWVYTFNPRARRVYEKAGFVAEGVEREVLLHEGTWHDAVRMSLLAHEWAARVGELTATGDGA